MKHLFTLLVLISFCTLSVHSQVVITRSNHGFNPGDEHIIQQVEYVAPGEEGQNITWDFSKLTLQDNVTISSITGADDNQSYNRIIKRDDNYTFLFNITEQGNAYTGYEVGKRKVFFSKPFVKTQYPQSYGTSFEGSFEGTIFNDGIASPDPISGTYSTQADATGTLLLPGGVSFPVLRVKTVDRINYCNCTNFYTEITKYLWYAQDVRYPLFVTMETVNRNTISGETHVVEKESSLNIDIKRESPNNQLAGNNGSNVTYKIFPNPFKDNIQVSYSLPAEAIVNIDLYNSKGVKVTSLVPGVSQRGEQTISRDLSQFTMFPDIYFLIMKFGNSVYTEKLVKAAY